MVTLHVHSLQVDFLCVADFTADDEDGDEQSVKGESDDDDDDPDDEEIDEAEVSIFCFDNFELVKNICFG